MKRFLSELQRRHVIRVAASYVVAGSILLQAAGALENALPALAGWFSTFVFSMLVLGFPVALVGSWLFEVTSEGIKRTVTFGDGVFTKPHTVDWILIGMLVVVTGVAIVQAVTLRTSEPKSDDNSIAILPFANRSQNKDDSEYGDWMAELISGLLGKAGNLRVISQTSASAFKGKEVRLPEIARQLGVSLVLEGSVRSEGDDIVISAQLFNAASDTQLWQGIYDRKTDNALSVQFEVAAKVAAAVAEKLGVKVSDTEQRAFQPTKEPEAYEAYRQGLKFYRMAGVANVRRAMPLLEQAVKLDPSFAPAWALLSRTHAYLSFNSTDATEGRRAAAEQALKTALGLEPELADVLLAEAYYVYWIERDYGGARRRFEKLSQKWPSNADILAALGSIARREGRWTQGKAYFDRAVALDPLHPSRRRAAAELRFATRDFPNAMRLLDESLDHWPDAPDSFPFIAKKALIHQALGRLDEADALLKDLHPAPTDIVVEPIVYQAILRRRHEQAIGLLQSLVERDQADGSGWRTTVDLNIYLGNLRRLAGDASGARVNYSNALDELRMESKKQPKSGDIYSYQALVYCGLGDRGAATKYAALAVESTPISKDALSGAYYEEVQARVWARLGDKKRAIPAIEKLIKLPAPLPLTPALLRLDPDFDKLRTDPRFIPLLNDTQ